jgi:hypothetical protein
VTAIRSRRLGSLVVPSLIALALIVSACTGSDTGSSPRSRPTGDLGTPATVRELTSIDTLRGAFNDDAGSTRLMLIISPT